MSKKKGFVLFCIGVLLCFAAAGETVPSSGLTAYHIDGAQEKPKTQKSYVHVRSNVSRARVYLDSSYKGETPLTFEVTPGYHRLELKKSHYATREVSFYVNEGHDKDFYLDMESIAGYIKIENEYSGVSVYLDSSSVSGGTVEVDEGNHVITAKKFGYETFSESVYVRRHTTSYVTVSLRKAEFNITALSASREVFNPANRGRLGEVTVDYSVTAPESGTFTIQDKYGNVYLSRNVSFSTWSGSVSWDGTDSRGYICADGEYTATLTAGTKTRTCTFSIDSSVSYPMVQITPDGSGTGPLSVPLSFPGGTLALSLGAGCYYTAASEVAFYGCPVNASLLWAITDHVEFSTTGAFFFNENTVRSLSGSLKFAFDARLSDSAALNFGMNLRAGGSNGALFPPYGADYMNGFGGGLMTGLSFGKGLSNYAGVTGEYIWLPIKGPSEDSSSGTLKCGVTLLKRTEDFGASVYGVFESCYGTYEYTASTGLVKVIDLRKDYRVYDAGLSIVCYPGESSMQLSFNAGVLFYPEDETYVYAKLNFSWLF